jgi:DNA helicase-2/ATP-dependent DNA helicase PcrA
MEENFRSTPQIVSTADIFIKHNAIRRDKHMITHNPSGAPITELVLKSRLSQYYELAKLVRADSGGDTAILFRNNDSALPLIDLFSRLAIPYRSRGNDSTFFTHYIIKDVLDFIRFSQSPYDKDVFMQIYYKMDCRISREDALTVVKSHERRKNGSFLLELAILSGINSKKSERLMALHSHLYALRSDTPFDAIYRIRHLMGYGSYLLRRGADTEKLNILRAIASQESDFDGLTARLDALKALSDKGGGDSGVILSTVHSSKGLEYDNVILIDVIDGIFPSIENPNALYITPDNTRTLEEERRLFYVAVTRARKKLTLLTYTGCSGTFVKQLLSRELPLKAPVTQHHSFDSATPKAPTISEKDVVVGTKLHHKHFGDCTVIDKSTSTITIALSDGAQKTLLLSACISGGLITLRKA